MALSPFLLVASVISSSSSYKLGTRSPNPILLVPVPPTESDLREMVLSCHVHTVNRSTAARTLGGISSVPFFAHCL